ncbi:MAG TPA: WhiB family transcriptional regulator [Acidimicrobiales bacterium]|nr:WhiB family transcriptional regulator [Acidimicrobiales bacterium]
MFAYSWAEHEDEIQQSTVTWEDAACRDGSGTLSALFFSEEIPDIDLAKAICTSCTLVEPCLRGALARREPVGVWGGQLFADGVVIPRKRKRGRPPKVAATASNEPTLQKATTGESLRHLPYTGEQRKTA